MLGELLMKVRANFTKEASKDDATAEVESTIDEYESRLEQN